jgi:charged multivesicular body protein 1
MSLTELQNLQFNLKFVGRQFAKSSKTCERDEKKEIDKCKAAMQKGNMETAKIFAQTAIRKKNEAVNFIKLAARMDAVSSRLDTAIKMKMVTRAMGAMVKGMDKVLSGMNPEHISQLMDTFERQFENVDVASEYMQDAIGQSAASTTPESEVTSLMAQVADEHGLNVKHLIGSSATLPGTALPAVAQPAAVDDDPELEAMSRRMAALGAVGGGKK